MRFNQFLPDLCICSTARCAEKSDADADSEDCILKNEGINAVALDENNRGTIRPLTRDIDYLDEYKTFQTVDYMIKNNYYATEDVLVAKLLATKLRDLTRQRVCTCAGQ